MPRKLLRWPTLILVLVLLAICGVVLSPNITFRPKVIALRSDLMRLHSLAEAGNPDPRTVTLAIRALESDDLFSRQLALGLLDASPAAAEAVPKLIAILKDHQEDPSVRRGAALVVIRLNEEQAFDPLLDILRDKETETTVRRTAAYGIGRLGKGKGFAALLGVLEDTEDDPLVRGSAADALATCDPVAAARPLQRFWDDKQEYVRNSARSALARAGKTDK